MVLTEGMFLIDMKDRTGRTINHKLKTINMLKSVLIHPIRVIRVQKKAPPYKKMALSLLALLVLKVESYT